MQALTQKVQLPAAPITSSPAPHLTGIHATTRRGPYGSNRYRRNCGGYRSSFIPGIHDTCMIFEEA
ncbi:hypothetical protein K227x_58840 [Rubripirellula lacrimiformis]|uniref:Uncharacterized protein n=1 Tax=Rubripirellula lacrimiformis TaxID=1930273 RepID=A0A517NJZ2_9BACT|nr:hypothetical protein K227x_58840 [Rubripirellula lacrimiformis]